MEEQNVIYDLYEIIKQRKGSPQEKSYSSYLFEQGLDKILKKCGEETAEMLIAAKNQDKVELANEICDLIYHMLVLMVESEVPLSNVKAILEERSQKIGNLKNFHQGNKDS
jgi:phosphoribosyl-ATP pyrophosphohydrolase